jgi:hypothetical protein
VSQGNGTSLAEKKRDVFLSRAASRRELAAVTHDVILPVLQQHTHNLNLLKQQLDAATAKIADLETRLATLEAK